MGSLEWEMVEYEWNEKDTEWYMALVIIVVCASVASVILDNILFAVIIVLSGITLALHAKKGPPLLRVRINDDGIVRNDTLYAYEHLKSYSIDRDKLLLERKGFWFPLLVIPVHDDIVLDEIHAILLERLPEHNHKEPFAHRLIELLGF